MSANRRIYEMSLRQIGLISILAFLTIASGQWNLHAAQPSSDQALLGRVWRVTEYGGWTATWTRRGDSLVFDGVWFNGSQKVTGMLAMAVQGRVVRIQSRQQTNGYDVDYEGTLSLDGRSIQGTLKVLGSGSIYDWKATIESADAPPADNINIPPDQALLGRVWRVTEYGGWTATWTRRGGSSVFDGVWFNGSQKVTGVLAMAVQGRVVRIQSRQQTNGYDVDYEGTLAQDGRSIQGTLTVLGPGGIYDWKATIESAAASPPADNINIPPDQALLGRVWRVTEYGGWTATWTRRGGSSVFDGVWFNGSQKVTGVLAMAVQGRVVRIQSRQQTNGYDVDYEGTLAQDGRSIQGTLTVLGPGGIYDWKATIESE